MRRCAARTLSNFIARAGALYHAAFSRPADRPLPNVYYDSRSLDLDRERRACLHAKCVVLDRQHVYVSSANFSADALPARVVLVSTSGVYGDCHGEWVDESRPARPDADRAHRRFDAETRLRRWAGEQAVPFVILRVPGIYGPGRLPVERLTRRLPVLREAESPWSNRVHVDDLVSACLAAARHGVSGAVYNVSDGHPSTMTDYFNQVADAVGLPRPPQITMAEARAQLSEGMQSYLAESKRLDNRRMREDLGVEPQYPDLTQGLAACVAAEAAGEDQEATG